MKIEDSSDAQIYLEYHTADKLFLDNEGRIYHIINVKVVPSKTVIVKEKSKAIFGSRKETEKEKIIPQHISNVNREYSEHINNSWCNSWAFEPNDNGRLVRISRAIQQDEKRFTKMVQELSTFVSYRKTKNQKIGNGISINNMSDDDFDNLIDDLKE